MVMRYMKRGYLQMPKLAESMRRAPRELFVEPHFSHLVYSDRPIPIPHSKGDCHPLAYQHPSSMSLSTSRKVTRSLRWAQAPVTVQPNGYR